MPHFSPIFFSNRKRNLRFNQQQPAISPFLAKQCLDAAVPFEQVITLLEWYFHPYKHQV
jgi:hypothetical protein